LKIKSNEELGFVPEISVSIQFILPSAWLSMMSTLSGLMGMVVRFIFVLAVTETHVSMCTSVKYLIINFEILLSYLSNQLYSCRAVLSVINGKMFCEPQFRL